jgi:hypothetical protein
MADGKYYLDPVAFTTLFKNNAGNRNRRRILAGFHLIAQGAARKCRAERVQDLEDAASDAVLLAAKKIPCFNPARADADAWQYFTTLILRAIRRRLHTETRHSRWMRQFNSIESWSP